MVIMVQGMRMPSMKLPDRVRVKSRRRTDHTTYMVIITHQLLRGSITRLWTLIIITILFLLHHWIHMVLKLLITSVRFRSLPRSHMARMYLPILCRRRRIVFFGPTGKLELGELQSDSLEDHIIARMSIADGSGGTSHTTCCVCRHDINQNEREGGMGNSHLAGGKMHFIDILSLIQYVP